MRGCDWKDCARRAVAAMSVRITYLRGGKQRDVEISETDVCEEHALALRNLLEKGVVWQIADDWDYAGAE